VLNLNENAMHFMERNNVALSFDEAQENRTHCLEIVSKQAYSP
jgi:hypothetical protein